MVDAYLKSVMMVHRVFRALAPGRSHYLERVYTRFVPTLAHKLADDLANDLGKAVQLDPALKALGFNFFKVWCFQAAGFKYQPAPLRLGHDKQSSLSALMKNAETAMKELDNKPMTSQIL